MIRVLLADDPIVRQGLRALLADEPEIAVVGEATTGDEVQEACRTLQPDVLLLDLSMPGPRPPIPSDRCVLSPAIQIVMLTAHRDEAAVRKL
jgi:DNA-binding NarL/FixJ family response regulator